MVNVSNFKGTAVVVFKSIANITYGDGNLISPCPDIAS